MKNSFLKIKAFVFAHKIISVIILAVVMYGGYWIYGNLTSTGGETRYVLTAVTKGTIVSSITGSGQVSASNQIDIMPKVSGAITYVGVKPGSQVGNGQVLFSIDNTNAQKAVRDAQANLQSTQIATDKLKIQNSTDNMNADLAKAYDDGYNTVSNTFLDLPGIVTSLHDMFFKSDINTSQWNIDWYEGQVSTADKEQASFLKNRFSASFQLAEDSYNKTLDSYKTTSRTASGATLDTLISDTYNTTLLVSDSIKDAKNYVDFVVSSLGEQNHNTPAIITTHQTNLNSYTSKTDTDLTNLVSATTNIKSSKDTFTNSNLDIQSQELSLQQKQNALADAQATLADYTVRAPFSGTIASVPVQKGDNASSGTTLATIITAQQLATISLNEVDIAKIQLGQKATLTFDAVPDLTITGQVSQIDSIGTVSQGVVNYNVKINFDTADSRIKPGMSVNAAIITNVAQNVLVVPSSAVKTGGGVSYVQMFDTALPAPLSGVQGSPSLVPPINQTVEIGISDGTSTEITSGLKEGDEIVTKTITSTTKTSATTAPSILGNTGSTRGSGAVRIGG